MLADRVGRLYTRIITWVLARTFRFCRRPVPFDVKITPRFPDDPAVLKQERGLRGL